jgi:hypothetical protein
MSPRSRQLILLSIAFAVMAASALPAAAGGQVTVKEKKAAAAAGTAPVQANGSRLRVMLVISDAVRSYRVSVMLSHVDFGRRLAAQIESLFPQSLSVVSSVSNLPSDPRAYDGVDLVVVVEAPEGVVHMGFMTNPMDLAVTFVVRNAKGEELFRAHETAKDNAQNANNGADRLGAAVTRQFIQELLSSASVRNTLSPPAPVEVKPVLADTSIMDSAGLDVPPPPPWAQANAPVAPPSANTAGKP